MRQRDGRRTGPVSAGVGAAVLLRDRRWKHVFKWPMRQARADDEGGCVPDPDYQVAEDNSLTAPGCCASGCQDETACESVSTRAYNSTSCPVSIVPIATTRQSGRANVRLRAAAGSMKRVSVV